MGPHFIHINLWKPWGSCACVLQTALLQSGLKNHGKSSFSSENENSPASASAWSVGLEWISTCCIETKWNKANFAKVFAFRETRTPGVKRQGQFCGGSLHVLPKIWLLHVSSTESDDKHPFTLLISVASAGIIALWLPRMRCQPPLEEFPYLKTS